MLRESTKSSSKRVAQEIFDKRVSEALAELRMDGVRRDWTVENGCSKYLLERSTRQLKDARFHCDVIMKYLAQVEMKVVHSDHPAVKKMVAERRLIVSNTTINHHLKVLQKILNDASRVWRDECGLSWIQEAPRIRLLKTEEVGGYALTSGEEKELLRHLPEHLRDCATLAIHTGLRSSVISQLRWDWEVRIPRLGVTVFDIPEHIRGVKNGRPHRVILNSISREVVERRRGQCETVVSRPVSGKFVPIKTMRTRVWRRAVERAGLSECRDGQSFRIHDLRHTCATRLREMGVSMEDRKDILGHVNQDITTHYSAPQVSNLLAQSELLVRWYEEAPLMEIHTGGHIGSTNCASDWVVPQKSRSKSL